MDKSSKKLCIGFQKAGTRWIHPFVNSILNISFNLIISSSLYYVLYDNNICRHKISVVS